MCLCLTVPFKSSPFFIAGDAVCPTGTKSVGGTCFIYHTDKSKSWDDARSICTQTAGSDLLIARNSDVINDIKRFTSQTRKGIFFTYMFPNKNLFSQFVFVNYCSSFTL